MENLAVKSRLVEIDLGVDKYNVWSGEQIHPTLVCFKAVRAIDPITDAYDREDYWVPMDPKISSDNVFFNVCIVEIMRSLFATR